MAPTRVRNVPTSPTAKMNIKLANVFLPVATHLPQLPLKRLGFATTIIALLYFGTFHSAMYNNPFLYLFQTIITPLASFLCPIGLSTFVYPDFTYSRTKTILLSSITIIGLSLFVVYKYNLAIPYSEPSTNSQGVVVKSLCEGLFAALCWFGLPLILMYVYKSDGVTIKKWPEYTIVG